MAEMTRVFKTASNPGPRSLIQYERAALEELGFTDRELPVETLRDGILDQARREAEQRVREAYDEGLRRGAEAGRAEFRQSVAECAAALRAAAGAVQQARRSFLESLEPQVLELAVTIAGRILQREVQTDRDLVRRTVRRALEHLADRESLVVKVHPDDLTAMRAHKVRLLEEFDGVQQIQVEADASVSPGGCVAASRLMEVDARLEAQLEAVLNALGEPANGKPEE